MAGKVVPLPLPLPRRQDAGGAAQGALDLADILAGQVVVLAEAAEVESDQAAAWYLRWRAQLALTRSLLLRLSVAGDPAGDARSMLAMFDERPA
jgi:hypothetical protein